MADIEQVSLRSIGLKLPADRVGGRILRGFATRQCMADRHVHERGAEPSGWFGGGRRPVATRPRWSRGS